MKLYLLLFCLLSIGASAIAQPAKIPVINLSEDLKFPPIVEIPKGLKQSYTEVEFSPMNDGHYDTTAVHRFSFDKDGRLLQEEHFQYMSSMNRGHYPLAGRVRSMIEDGRMKGYVYDDAGNLRDELSYEVIPDNSTKLINDLIKYRGMILMSANQYKDRDDLLKALDPYVDSLVKTDLPGNSVRVDSIHTWFNKYGNPDSIGGFRTLNKKSYEYIYDKSGRVHVQRELRLRDMDGKLRWRRFEEHHFQYAPDGCVVRVTSYRRGPLYKQTDTFTDIVIPMFLYRDQTNYAGVSGRIDSVVYRDNYTVVRKHFTYEGAKLLAQLVLDSDRTAGRFDTISNSLYSYGSDGLLKQFYQDYWFRDKSKSTLRDEFVYDKEGRLIEVKHHNPQGGSDRLNEQRLYFYNTPSDQQTAARKIGVASQPAYKIVSQQQSKPAVSPAAQQKSKPVSPSKEVFVFVEQMPQFQGDLGMYLTRNLRYPPAAKKAGTEGRAMVKFIVETDGSIREVSVERSAGQELDAEAIRLVKSMPHWIPGRQNGVQVAVWMRLPVTFYLK